MQPGRCVKCDQYQTVSCLPQWGHTSYKRQVFNVHINLQYKYVDGEKGENGWLTTMPTKHNNFTFKFSYYFKTENLKFVKKIIDFAYFSALQKWLKF